MMAYGRGFNSPRLHHNVKSQPLSGWDFFCPFPLCCGAVSRVGLLSTLRRAQIRVERHQGRNLLARGLVVCFGVDRAESMFSSVAGQAIATVSASTASYSLWVPTNFTRTNWVESNHEQGGQQPDLPSSFGLNQASTPSSRWRTPPARGAVSSASMPARPAAQVRHLAAHAWRWSRQVDKRRPATSPPPPR